LPDRNCGPSEAFRLDEICLWSVFPYPPRRYNPRQIVRPIIRPHLRGHGEVQIALRAKIDGPGSRDVQTGAIWGREWALSRRFLDWRSKMGVPLHVTEGSQKWGCGRRKLFRWPRLAIRRTLAERSAVRAKSNRSRTRSRGERDRKARWGTYRQKQTEALRPIPDSAAGGIPGPIFVLCGQNSISTEAIEDNAPGLRGQDRHVPQIA
jgi:hypothetical protein